MPSTVPMMMALGHNDTWRVVINAVTPAPVISATDATFYVHIYFRPTHTLFHSNHHQPPRPLHSAFNMTVYFKTSDLPNPILLTAPENIAFVRKLEEEAKAKEAKKAARTSGVRTYYSGLS